MNNDEARIIWVKSIADNRSGVFGIYFSAGRCRFIDYTGIMELPAFCCEKVLLTRG